MKIMREKAKVIKLRTFKFYYQDDYTGEVEAKNKSEAVEKVGIEMSNNADSHFDGGQLVSIEEVKNE